MIMRNRGYSFNNLDEGWVLEYPDMIEIPTGDVSHPFTHTPGRRARYFSGLWELLDFCKIHDIQFTEKEEK